MRRGRLFVGSLGSLVWPAVVVLVPAGITFAAARVYAEGAPPPLTCDSKPVVVCADAAELQVCSFGRYGGGPGVCFGEPCIGDGGGRSCYDVQFCKDESAADCRAQTEGAECNGGKGRCRFRPAERYDVNSQVHSVCYEIDAGIGVQSEIRDCVLEDAGGADAAVDFNDAAPSEATPDATPSGNEARPASSNDDSGCATTHTTTLPLLGGAMSLGILLSLRGRRRRR